MIDVVGRTDLLVPFGEANVSCVPHLNNIFRACFLVECDCVCALMKSRNAKKHDFVWGLPFEQLIPAAWSTAKSDNKLDACLGAFATSCFSSGDANLTAQHAASLQAKQK